MRKLQYLFLLVVASIFSSITSAQSYFKFAQVTDTHIGSSKSDEDLRGTVLDINSDTSLRFVIITGDITEFGTDKELQLAKSILDGLNKPWYIIPGNHDACWSESGANSFRTIFGSETVSFQYGGYVFAGTACGPNMRMGPGQVPRENIVWLDSVLQHLPDASTPVIYMNHYPQDSTQNNWYEVMDRLKKKNIQLILCGHGHANKAFNFEGIPGIMGRSNLRAKDSIGGYNIVTFHDDTVIYQQKKPGLPVQAAWTKALLFNHHFQADTIHYFRPSFAVNNLYPKVKKLWQYQAQSDMGTGNILLNKLIIGTDTNGWIFALNSKNGKKKWAYRTHGKIYSTPAVLNEYVVAASTDRYIYCLKAGKLVWKYETQKPVVASPVINGHTVYIGGSDGHFRALDVFTGKLLWDFDQVKGFVVTRPLVYGDYVYFGCWENDFYALDKISGKLVWKWNNGSGSRMYSPAACYSVAAHGRVFIVAPDNIMTAFDAYSGKVVWRQRAPKMHVRESMGLSGDSALVYVKVMEGVLIGVSTTAPNIQINWQPSISLGYEICPTPLLESKGVLYVPTHSGTVWAIDKKESKLLWRYKASNCMVNGILPLGKERFLISTMDGKLTCIGVN